MNSFIEFLKNPCYKGSFKRLDLKDMILLYGSYFILIIPVGLIIFFISSLLNIKSGISSLSGYDKIIYGIAIAPVAEELIFRLILIFKKKNILILAVVFLLLSAYYFFNRHFSGAILMIFLSLFLCITDLLFFKSIGHCLINHYKTFFYSVALLFAFIHIFNFNGISASNFYLAAIFVMPQFFLGCILGYVRVTYGIVFSILFHLMVNLPLMFSIS